MSSCKRQKYYACSRGPMQHSRSRYYAFCSITWLTRISLRTWQHSMETLMQPLHCDLQPWKHSCSHDIAICNQKVNKRTEPRTHEQSLVAAHRGGTDSTLKQSPATAAHTRYLSSPAAATLRGKTQGFVLRLFPNTSPMQQLLCVLQHHVANPHLATHMATQHENMHCDLQAESQQAHRTTHT